jgi:long-chain acyl-CoA synthetase
MSDAAAMAAPPRRLHDIVDRWAADRPAAPALIEGGEVWSYRDLAEKSRAAAAWLETNGVGAGDRLMLVNENSLSLAALMFGASRLDSWIVLVNARLTPREVDLIREHCAPRRVVYTAAVSAEAAAHAERHGAASAGTPFGNVHLGKPDEGAAPEAVHGDGTKQAAVLVYTTGTTGAPKGVMLSHGAIISNCMGAQNLLKEETTFGEEVFLSFLPLSHSYEHMAGQFVPISIGAQIYYAESVETLVNNMAEAKPTIMTAVPRLYETMHTRIVRGLAKMPNLRRKLFLKAVELGKKNYEAPGSLGFGARILNGILDKLVRKKVAQRFGGRLKFFISGGAPLNEDIGLFFTALGVRLLQGYGQTESAPLISCNPTRGYKMHTVGPPVKGVELRVAEDGEICVRGELVMQGYYGNEAATAEVIKDGWLHTGDVGHQDEDGYIQITDRKKDIIINSGGDNISPQRIEGILTLQPEIGQAMVYGDQRPHLVALVVPDEEYLVEWAKRTGKSGRLAEAVGDGGLREEISAAVDRVNSDLAVIERVRKFIVAGDTFTIENGLMTPSMKIRRYKIKDIYSEKLDALY